MPQPQLDRTEHDQPENGVVERNVRFQLPKRDLDDRSVDREQARALVDATDSETTDDKSGATNQCHFDVGYTVVSRLAALHSTGIRSDLEEGVTVSGERGPTPATGTLVDEGAPTGGGDRHGLLRPVRDVRELDPRRLRRGHALTVAGKPTRGGHCA